MPARRRMTRAERDVVEEGLREDEGVSWAELACRTGRAATTVAREVGRNGGRSRYSAEGAQARALREAHRPKTPVLCKPGWLRDRVRAELAEKRSPAAITADLRAEGGSAVCHETIYQAVFAGHLDVRACDVLRTRRPKRRRRQARHERKRPGVPNIAKRPEKVNERAVEGHWEQDLIIGARNRSGMLCGIERKHRYGAIVTLPEGYLAESVLAAQFELFDQVPAHLRLSVTFDQGSEWARWERLADWYDLDVWFCDPHSPWQRGGIENYNGHVRYWFPRGTNLSIVDPGHADAVATLLNRQRRRSLGWDSPEARWLAAGGIPLASPLASTC